MSTTLLLDLWQRALALLLVLALPTVVAAAAATLLWMILKDFVGLREAGRGIIPKLIAILVAFVASAPWIVGTLTEFARQLLVSAISR
jgi:flagellar biosynthesis protein FliQ